MIMNLTKKYFQQFFYKIINIYINFKETKEKKGILYAIYFSMFFSLFYNPLKFINVVRFNRIIGAGIISDVDVTRRITNFKILFIFFFLSFIFFFALINYLKLNKSNNIDNKLVFKFLDNFIILSNIQIILRAVSDYFNDEYVFSYSSSFIMLILLIGLSYICFNIEKKIRAKNYIKVIIIELLISIPLSILFRPTEKGLLGFQILGFIFTILIIKFGRKKINDRIIENIGIVSIVFIPLITSLFIELINILNQNRIFVSNPRKWYIILIIFIFVCFSIENFLSIKLKDWKKLLYPVIIIGVTSLSVQLSLQQIYNPSIFESANSSILISDFLNNGSIPIIEHYGGHMMTDVLEGIIYGLLNKDFIGASLSPYSVYFMVILSIIFYFFIKEVWNEEMALLSTLTFPFYNFWNYFGLGMFLYFVVINYIKKSSYKNAMLLWLSISCCMLYRMDLGYAFGLSAILTLLFYIFKTKKWDTIRYLAYPLFIIIILGVAIWSVVCLSKSINPTERLVEFLKISFSNQNWAYETIGETKKSLFLWTYGIVPFSVIVCISFSIFFKKKFIKEYILILYLGISYFVNFSRGIVRHSLVEYSDSRTIWTALVLFAIFFSTITKNKKNFIVSLTFLVFLNTLLFKKDFNQLSILENMNSKIYPIINTWSEKDKNEKTMWQNLKENNTRIERVVLSDEIRNTVSEYGDIVDVLLEKNETFIDYMNRTLLYSMLNRKNPVYVSQSPLQLSGEFTQEKFIKQIEDIPIIFMPVTEDDNLSITLDGIPNSYRYYKVSEYIYQNYEPLLKFGEKFSVWCLKEKCKILKKKAENLTKKEDYSKELFNKEMITLKDVEIKKNNDKTAIISKGTDPFIYNLQNIMNLKKYNNKSVRLIIDYESNIEGNIQLFYTTNQDEDYSEEKSIINHIAKKGKTEFIFPVTEFTKLRLDIPENSNVEISSFEIGSPIEFINYGYDGPNAINGGVDYLENVHNYNIQWLPFIWAEYDVKKAINNKKVENIYPITENIFIFNNIQQINKTKGNYILISLTYNEDITDKKNLVVKLGNYDKGSFFEKNQYIFNLKPGRHNYLLRVSSDYYWYLNQINAVKIAPENNIRNIEMNILEGD